MIIDNLYFEGVTTHPTKYYSPLVIYPNRVEIFPATL
jgi:hypothetical protein